MGLHIAALFVLLISSGLGVFAPVVFGGLKQRPWLSTTLFILKHFGTGIIISTAFIHLLMHAFVMFANECLGELGYEAVAPAIAMGSLFVFFLVDFFAGRWMIHKHQKVDDENSLPAENKNQNAFTEHAHVHGVGGLTLDGSSKQAHWDVQLLEAGVAFHSIMIGVSLGAQAESGFISTFCAIIFHQLFEGLGLGSRIATLSWPEGGKWRKWGMCLAYTFVTPVGIAIGIGVHESFNINGRAALISIGVLDSIAAGILLYAGVCQLLMSDWINGEMLLVKRSKAALGLVSLFLGVFAMSLIGKWA
ncbi:Zinc/iron permease [Hymenopellis radicata]|nr:Zinc/iron permease [Hymenopellis radicata]